MRNFLGEIMSQQDIVNNANSLKSNDIVDGVFTSSKSWKRRRKFNFENDDKREEKTSKKYSSCSNNLSFKPRTLFNNNSSKPKTSRNAILPDFRFESIEVSCDMFFWADLRNIFSGSKNFHWPAIVFTKRNIEDNMLEADVLEMLLRKFTFPVKPGYSPKKWIMNFICIEIDDLVEYPNNSSHEKNLESIARANKVGNKYWTKRLQTRYNEGVSYVRQRFASLQQVRTGVQNRISVSTSERYTEKKANVIEESPTGKYTSREKLFQVAYENSLRLEKDVSNCIKELIDSTNNHDLKRMP